MWGLGACMNGEISLFVTFLFLFSFLHLAYRSPQWTDFHDLYIKRRVFAHESAFWRNDDEFLHLPPFFPQNLKICITAYGNSNGNNSAIFEERSKMFVPKVGIFGDG